MPADTVTPERRSRIMAGIRSRDTKPEFAMRSALHRRGFRYRLYRRDLPGKPDLVFSKHHAVMFVHGCFWHGHDCHLFRWPETRREFWHEKITANINRDRNQRAELLDAGWRVATVWECALRGRGKLSMAVVTDICVKWLESDEKELELRCDETRTTA